MIKDGYAGKVRSTFANWGFQVIDEKKMQVACVHDCSGC